MIPLEHYIIVSAILFSIGIVIIIAKKNAIVVLMGIELILNAANINLIAFSQYDSKLQGQFFALFIIVIAAAEASVALAIVLRVFNYFKTVDINKIDELKG